MSYEVKLDEADSVINVKYYESVTLDERKEAVETACYLYSHKRPLRILVNFRELEVIPTKKEQKLFGEYLASHPKLTQGRVAVLHKESHNPSLFIDSHAFSKVYKLAEFNDNKNAGNWLKQ